MRLLQKVKNVRIATFFQRSWLFESKPPTLLGTCALLLLATFFDKPFALITSPFWGASTHPLLNLGCLSAATQLIGAVAAAAIDIKGREGRE